MNRKADRSSSQFQLIYAKIKYGKTQRAHVLMEPKPVVEVHIF